MTRWTGHDEVNFLVNQTRSRARGLDVASLRTAFDRVLADLNVSRDRLEAWRDGLDVAGTAYELLLTGAQRRAAGQFFTPFWAGEVMASWLYREPVSVVLDAGCGSGGLLIPASRHPSRGKSRLLGIDLDPLAIRMAELNLRLRRINGCELRVLNFLTDDLAETPDRVVCNPPYSRHHAIAQEEKKAIHDDLAHAFGSRFSGRTSLQALFLLRALEVSSDDASLAFITPSDWLDVNYGLEIKRCLVERAQVEAMILLDAEHLFFDGARTTAAITLIRKGANGPTKIIRLRKELPSPGAILASLISERAESGMTVEQRSLTSEGKWARHRPKRRRGVRLAEVARVHRGVATGANHFFCLSEAERQRRHIPRDELRPCLTSPKLFDQEDLTEDALDRLPETARRWLIDCGDPTAERAKTPLGAYLRRGRRLGVHRGYLVSRRKPWYVQEQRGRAPILFTYLNKRRPRFLRNRLGAVPLNNWLVIEPREGVDTNELYRALSAPTVLAQLREQARVYGGGLWKLEPSELEQIRLPSWFSRVTL